MVAQWRTRMERDLLRSQTSIQAQRVEALTENKAEYEEIIVETQAQIAEVHEANRKLAEHEELVTHSVEKLAHLEAEREQLLVDIGKAKARALRLTRVVLTTRQQAARRQQQAQLAQSQSIIPSPRKSDADADENNGDQAAQLPRPPNAPPPSERHRSRGGRCGGGVALADDIAIWSTAHYSNADIAWR